MGELKLKGATLIELLIVVSILMGMLAITGSLTIKTIERAKAQTEYISLQGLIRAASVKAFTSGSGLSIAFHSNELSISVGDRVLSEKKFDHLDFGIQNMKISRNGFPNVEFIEVRVNEVNKRIDLQSLLKAPDTKR